MAAFSESGNENAKMSGRLSLSMSFFNNVSTFPVYFLEVQCIFLQPQMSTANNQPQVSVLVWCLKILLYKWGNLNFSDTLLPWLNSSQRSKFINRMWQLLSFTHPLLLCRINSWPWGPCRSWSLCSHQTDTSWPLRLKPA